MTDQNEAQTAHATLHAGHTGVVVSQLLDEDWTPTADPSSNALTEAIDGVLHLTADLARRLIGAHQAAAALIIAGDWTSMRKYFSQVASAIGVDLRDSMKYDSVIKVAFPFRAIKNQERK